MDWKRVTDVRVSMAKHIDVENLLCLDCKPLGNNMIYVRSRKLNNVYSDKYLK